MCFIRIFEVKSDLRTLTNLSTIEATQEDLSTKIKRSLQKKLSEISKFDDEEFEYRQLENGEMKSRVEEFV